MDWRRAFGGTSPAAGLSFQVGDHLLLGRYCLAVGRIEEAREHLTFAAERGGPMYVGNEAAELLRTLRRSPRDGKN